MKIFEQSTEKIKSFPISIVRFLLAAFFLSLISLFPLSDSLAAPSFGPNILVSEDIGPFSSSDDGPPILDVDIASGVYVAWIDHRYSQTEVFFSKLTPSGSSFSSNKPLTGINDAKSFPQIEEDNGSIYVAWGERRIINNTASQGIFFTKSTNGGQTFSEEIIVDSNDNLPISMVAHNNKILIAYTKGGNQIWLASSVDGGSTFASSLVSDSTDFSRHRPSVDFKNNNVYVSWYDERSGSGDVFFAKSADGGTTFSPNKSIYSNPDSAMNRVGVYFGRLLQKVSSEGQIYIAFDFFLGQDSSNFDNEVFFMKSSNEGETFTNALRLPDDPISNRKRQSNPSLTILPDDSPVVAWFDERDTPETKTMLAYSQDKGQTFSTNINISNTPSPNTVYTAPTVVSDGEGKIHFVRGDTILSQVGIWYTKIDLGLNFPKAPYFSQKDPQWGSQEYDHASSLGLDCGTTIAQCGCALTSAAMLLKYYGVDKSPDSFPTTPKNLNEWLKNNEGYTFGSVRWPSIASYSVKANEIFGTQKIRLVGFGQSNDFTTLSNELDSNRPVILSVKDGSHFVVATGHQGSNYSINDPISQNNTTLQSYGNIFQGMRLYEKTSTDLSTIYISTPAPTEIFITDSLGRKAGKDLASGVIYSEIPNSFYFLEPTLADDSNENAHILSSGNGITTLAIINPGAGKFDVRVSNLGTNVAIDFASYDRHGEIITKEFSQTIPQGGTQEYTLNYSPEPGSQIQVTQVVNIDIKPGNDPNSINLKNNGVIPVAIMTTPNFDATQVDGTTVKLGLNQATEIHDKAHLEDIDMDGDIDLVLHFITQITGIQNNDTKACLTGATLNGMPIQGCDAVKIIH